LRIARSWKKLQGKRDDASAIYGPVMWFWADDPPRLADAERFLAAVREHARHWFDPVSPVWVARAPGRLDLMEIGRAHV